MSNQNIESETIYVDKIQRRKVFVFDVSERSVRYSVLGCNYTLPRHEFVALFERHYDLPEDELPDECSNQDESICLSAQREARFRDAVSEEHFRDAIKDMANKQKPLVFKADRFLVDGKEVRVMPHKQQIKDLKEALAIEIEKSDRLTQDKESLKNVIMMFSIK